MMTNNGFFEHFLIVRLLTFIVHFQRCILLVLIPFSLSAYSNIDLIPRNKRPSVDPSFLVQIPNYLVEFNVLPNNTWDVGLCKG